MKVYEKIGLDYIFENLEVITSIAKKKVSKIEFLTDISSIYQEYDNIEKTKEYFGKNIEKIKKINRKLMEIKDITNTLIRLKEGYILDDIELFEIKIFSMISQDILENLTEEVHFISPKDLKNVIEILDPDNLGVASFHIYNSYSEELRRIREKLKTTNDPLLYEQEMGIEDLIRKDLSSQLRFYAEDLMYSIDKISYLDLILAKNKQIDELNLIRPKISGKTKYKNIFNPKVLNHLNSRGRNYQKIDIAIDEKVTVITGANMSGKTLTLKTLALCQYLCQMGFYVPAEWAEIKLVDGVFLNIGDNQSIDSGLSSYASEMLEINRIIYSIKNGLKPLVLIDELARTTNPQEGKAIVRSIIDILYKMNIESVITTHYDGIGTDIYRLRVRGLKFLDIPKNISEKNIEDYIDYSFVEDNLDKVPEEALAIAKLLQIDSEIINRAYTHLKGGNTDV